MPEPTGAWVAQSVELPTLDFWLSHDPRVTGSSPGSGFMLTVEPAYNSVSLPLPLSLTRSLKAKKKKKKKGRA